MEKIRLLLADDHNKVRNQILTRLRRESDLEVVAEAANSMQVIKFAMSKRPQVILIDPRMRDGRGIEAISRIRSRLPDTQVVVLTAIVDTMLRVELSKVGVRQFLTKGIPSRELVRTLREGGVGQPPAQLRA
jgi:two-component system nitrate/nitrite response regulator NarL